MVTKEVASQYEMLDSIITELQLLGVPKKVIATVLVNAAEKELVLFKQEVQAEGNEEDKAMLTYLEQAAGDYLSTLKQALSELE